MAKKMMQSNWESMPQYFRTSATSSLGKEELLIYIGGLNVEIAKNH